MLDTKYLKFWGNFKCCLQGEKVDIDCVYLQIITNKSFCSYKSLIFGTMTTEPAAADHFFVSGSCRSKHTTPFSPPHSSSLTSPKILRLLHSEKINKIKQIAHGVFCVVSGYLWVVSIQGETKTMHASLHSSSLQSLTCGLVHMPRETPHPMLRSAQEKKPHTPKNRETYREREKSMQTFVIPPPTRLRRKQSRGGSEARDSLLSANLYMIEKKKGEKLFIASQLHRIWWRGAVSLSSFYCYSCHYFSFGFHTLNCGEMKAEWRNSFGKK